jgi:hypothetical protein
LFGNNYDVKTILHVTDGGEGVCVDPGEKEAILEAGDTCRVGANIFVFIFRSLENEFFLSFIMNSSIFYQPCKNIQDRTASRTARTGEDRVGRLRKTAMIGQLEQECRARTSVEDSWESRSWAEKRGQVRQNVAAEGQDSWVRTTGTRQPWKDNHDGTICTQNLGRGNWD